MGVVVVTRGEAKQYCNNCGQSATIQEPVKRINNKILHQTQSSFNLFLQLWFYFLFEGRKPRIPRKSAQLDEVPYLAITAMKRQI